MKLRVILFYSLLMLKFIRINYDVIDTGRCEKSFFGGGAVAPSLVVVGW
jgi:hypothetical protein